MVNAMNTMMNKIFKAVLAMCLLVAGNAYAATMKLKPTIFAALYYCVFAGVGLQPSTVLADPIYIDVSSGTPVVLSPSPNYWPNTTSAIAGWESSVTQIASGAWQIDMALTGAYQGTSNGIRGLELTDPKTGAIVDSFGVDYFVYNNLMSWTTIHAELYTINASGDLAGRTSRINNAVVPSEPLMLGSPQLAMYGINTEWNTWEIYLTGMAAQPSSVPIPGAIWLSGSALAGLIGFSRRKLLV